jgi:iron complex outermembrane receptor protein
MTQNPTHPRPLSHSRPRLTSLTLRALCLLTTVGVVATLSPVSAQTAATGLVEGRVQNGSSGTYLTNARVRVVGSNVEVFTNAFGEYRIPNLPAGPATLEVFYTGLAPKRVSVTVPATGAAQQDVELGALGAETKSDGTILMKEFTVQSQRETDAAAIAINEQRFAANRKDVISTDAFGDINQGNIGEFVKFIPGISLDVKDGNSPSGIMIRGFDPNYTNVTMDGGQLASTLIANTQTSSRGFLLEQANINNLSRIEVTKLPTPDMSANLLGGAVNFVSKSAFERSRPELRFQAFLSGNSSALEFKKTPGPGSDDSYKVRPNFDVTYVNPLSKRLGIVLNVSQSSQYYLQNKAVPGRRYTSAGATITNPQTSSFAASYAPNQIDRTSGSINVDWKPWSRHVFSFSAQANANRQEQSTRTQTFNVGGATPTSWDEHNTIGSFTVASNGTVTGGSVSLGNSFQSRNGLLRAVGGRWVFTGTDWQSELAGSWSNSNNRVRDMAKGFWNGMGTSLANVRRVSIEGLDNSMLSVQKLTAYDAAGQVIDTTKLANYNLGQLQSQPADSQDTVKELRGSVTRSLKLLGAPVSLKLGGSANDMIRDAKYSLWTTTYAGPNGILNDGDENMAAFIDDADAGRSPGFGVPGPQWASPWKVHDAFIAHPSWFVRTTSNVGDTVKNEATRSPWLHETIYSGYIMGDTKLINNRLRVVTGVRYEKTVDEGRGYKQDVNAIYVKDAAGHPVKGTNGQYILLPQFAGQTANNGSAEQNAAIYQYRANYNKRDYAYFFPSVHTTFSITENLQLRAAFARTMGRPNVSDVVPNLFVQDNVNFGNGQSSGAFPGFITGANSTLKPWTAKNYDYTLEYYLPRNGLLMFNWYKKDITNFFSTINTTADAALLDTLGLSHDYVGYQYSTRINVSDAMIKGWEASINLPLENLTKNHVLERFDPIARHFSIMLNTTHLELSGSRITASDWKRYIPRSRNAGVRFNWGKFSGNMLLNWRGKMLRDTSSSFPGASEYIRARYQLDGNIDYQLTKHFALYLAGRNITNASSEWEVSGANAATYDFLTNYERYGVQYSLGLRGTF